MNTLQASLFVLFLFYRILCTEIQDSIQNSFQTASTSICENEGFLAKLHPAYRTLVCGVTNNEDISRRFMEFVGPRAPVETNLNPESFSRYVDSAFADFLRAEELAAKMFFSEVIAVNQPFGDQLASNFLSEEFFQLESPSLQSYVSRLINQAFSDGWKRIVHEKCSEKFKLMLRRLLYQYAESVREENARLFYECALLIESDLKIGENLLQLKIDQEISPNYLIHRLTESVPESDALVNQYLEGKSEPSGPEWTRLALTQGLHSLRVAKKLSPVTRSILQAIETDNEHSRGLFILTNEKMSNILLDSWDPNSLESFIDFAFHYYGRSTESAEQIAELQLKEEAVKEELVKEELFKELQLKKTLVDSVVVPSHPILKEFSDYKFSAEGFLEEMIKISFKDPI